jgi:hypothetical protein
MERLSKLAIPHWVTSISNSGASWGETPLGPGSIDAKQQPTKGGARAPPQNVALAGLAFIGAAPDVDPGLADNSTDAATNKWIGGASGGFHHWGSAGRGDAGAARPNACTRRTGCAAAAAGSAG